MYLYMEICRNVKVLHLFFILAEIISYMEMRYIFYFTGCMFYYSVYFLKTKINLTHIFINIINMNNLHMTLI